MTDTPAPDAAVQIVAEALAYAAGARYPADDVCAALARAGWLHDPKRVAELEAVTGEVRKVRDLVDMYGEADESHLRPLFDALDALAALDTAQAGTEASDPTRED